MKKQLYLVTDSYDYEEEKFLDIIEQACRAGVSILQLREKERTDRQVLELAKKVKEITDKYKIPLIIDDRMDVAMILSCGLHLGQTDIPVKYARKFLGKDAIIGASAKTLDQAITAQEEGASYLGVGAIYPTNTKVITRITEVSTLKQIANTVNVPTFAIGGLKKDNLSVLENSGISGICVVSAVMKAEDPYQASKDLIENINKLK